MVETLTADDFTQIGNILQQILANDNEQRKAAEAQLNTAKSQQTDKYALVLASCLHPNQS